MTDITGYRSTRDGGGTRRRTLGVRRHLFMRRGGSLARLLPRPANAE